MPDRDPIDDGGWPEWRRLVLSEQRRFGHELRELVTEVRQLAKHADVEELERRVVLIEAKLLAGQEKGESNKWLIGVAILVVASIILPSVRVLLFGGSGG